MLFILRAPGEEFSWGSDLITPCFRNLTLVAVKGEEEKEGRVTDRAVGKLSRVQGAGGQDLNKDSGTGRGGKTPEPFWKKN